MTWSIKPQGVSTVLTNVESEAEGLGTALDSLGGEIQSGTKATNSAPIGVAVQSFFDFVATPRLADVSKRITASLTGASNATRAYLDGDEQMALQSQRDQVNIVAPERPQQQRGAN